MTVPRYPLRVRDRYLRATLCVVSLLFSSAVSAFAQEAPQPDAEAASFENPASAATRLRPATAPFPAAVQAAVDEGRQECLAEGGTKFVAGPGFVRRGDLTGTAGADYAVDFREAHCTDRLTVFSGTGGWDLVLFVGQKAGEPVRVFSGRVLDYDLEGGSGRRTVRFTLHGSYCGRVGADSCIKRRRLDGRPFAFRN
jgi:hypothetical protein